MAVVVNKSPAKMGHYRRKRIVQEEIKVEDIDEEGAIHVSRRDRRLREAENSL